MKLYGAILGDLAGQPYEFNYKGDYSEFDIHDKKSPSYLLPNSL
jgi:ADP-ribosylglycohydrolase